MEDITGTLLFAVPSVVILGVTYAASRRVGDPGRRGTKVVLRPNQSDRRSALLYVFLMTFLAGMFLAYRRDSFEEAGNWWIPCVVIVLSLLVTAAFIQELMRTVILDEIGIKVRGLDGPHPREIKWVNVMRIVRRYSAEYGIENTQGQWIYLQAKMDGFRLFVEECKKRLSPEVLGGNFQEATLPVDVPAPDLEGFRDARPPEL